MGSGIEGVWDGSACSLWNGFRAIVTMVDWGATCEGHDTFPKGLWKDTFAVGAMLASDGVCMSVDAP